METSPALDQSLIPSKIILKSSTSLTLNDRFTLVKKIREDQQKQMRNDRRRSVNQQRAFARKDLVENSRDAFMRVPNVFLPQPNNLAIAQRLKQRSLLTIRNRIPRGSRGAFFSDRGQWASGEAASVGGGNARRSARGRLGNRVRSWGGSFGAESASSSNLMFGEKWPRRWSSNAPVANSRQGSWPPRPARGRGRGRARGWLQGGWQSNGNTDAWSGSANRSRGLGQGQGRWTRGGRGGFRGGRGRPASSGWSGQGYEFGRGRGRGRGFQNRGRVRGASARGGGTGSASDLSGSKKTLTREELDKQMEEYMAKTKSALDSQLDSYMTQGTASIGALKPPASNAGFFSTSLGTSDATIAVSVPPTQPLPSQHTQPFGDAGLALDSSSNQLPMQE